MLVTLLREHLRPHRRALLAVAVLQTAGTVAALVVPALNGSLIDDGIDRHDTSAVWHAGSLTTSPSSISGQNAPPIPASSKAAGRNSAIACWVRAAAA